ncbi:MAG: sigma-54-dependent transcriptional regulator [bacterium]
MYLGIIFMPQILIADDEKSVLEGLALVLKGYNPETALNKEQAIKILKEYAIDLLVCDLYFPNLEDGIFLIKEAKEISPDTFIVVLTGYGSIETAVQAIKSGADDYLVKGIAPEELKIKIEGYIKIAKERQQLSHLRAVTESMSEQKLGYELIGESPAMIALKKKIEKAGKESRANVLITGETGSGKEVCARMIHFYSPCKNYPFLAIDCPSIPDNLFESELFGYEKGAFTDAKQRKLGKVELAHQGTLFLDEIGDLPLMLQSKLLRFLETEEFYRLGGTRPVKVDTRIIASTNQNIEELIKNGKFREDLYFRLKLFVIEMPPLRERKEDIPLLAKYFMDIFDPLKKKHHLLSRDLLDNFQRHNWPGNVRELKNIIEYLVMTESTEEVIRMITPKNFEKDVGQGFPDPLGLASGSLAK